MSAGLGGGGIDGGLGSFGVALRGGAGLSGGPVWPGCGSGICGRGGLW